MLELVEVNRVARDAASPVAHAEVSRVESSVTPDLDGRDALRVIVVLGRDAEDMLRRRAVLDTIVAIRNALQERGEERFPLVEFAREDEVGGHPDHQP